ncbi:MAG: hypothetical protein M9905_16205 [Rhizobiaceae bacterium]|nr:hypothetical protein [Rhizobiaceae bacterium]
MLARLIAVVVSGEVGFAARRLRRKAIVMAVAALMSLFGLMFLLVAGYLAAARRFGAVEAAIGFGVAFLVIGLVLLLVQKIMSGISRRRAAERRGAETKALMGAAALAVLPSLLSRGGLATVAVPAALLAAYAIYRENAGNGGSAPDDGRDDTD